MRVKLPSISVYLDQNEMDLSVPRVVGSVSSDVRPPISLRWYTTSFVASERAMISASHEDSAVHFCLCEPYEIAAPCQDTSQPDIEFVTSHNASESAESGTGWPRT